MDSQSLKTIISKRFSEQIQDMGPDIFKVVSKYGDRNIAAHYFDCSQNFLKPEFDLLDYQRNLLGNDYYSNSGSLQWNYYLYFLTDSEGFPINKKIEIESDKSYSRKLVTTQEELIKLIEVQPKLKALSKPIQSNALLTIWKAKLKSAGLASIYLIKEFPKPNDIFLQFASAEPILEPEDMVQTISNDTKVSFLKSITIKNFRCFKEEGTFKLSKVNLISGVNGTGKTSLLEAIELCLCGRTIENSKTEKADKLEILFVDGTLDTYSPGNNKKFQDRDRAWYGNNKFRGNSLSEGFHIYNFFDSDAAFRFSHESNSGAKIQEIFARIILGEETNVVFDRIQRFFERANSETKQLNESLENNEVEASNYRSKIIEFDSGAASITTLSEIINALDSIEWRGTNLLLSESTSRKQFNEELTKVSNYINTASILFGEKDYSSILLSSEFETVQGILLQHKNLNTSIDAIVDALNISAKSRKLLEGHLQILDRAAKYYVEDQIGAIKELSQNIVQLTRSSQQLSEIIELVNGLNVEKEEVLENADSIEVSRLSSQEVALSSAKTKLSILHQTLGTINKLTADLKRIGLEHIHFSKNYHQCPLCQTNFKEGDILKRVESLQAELKDEALIGSITKDIQTLETQVGGAKFRLDNIRKIKSLLSTSNIFNFQDYKHLRFYEVSDKLRVLREQYETRIDQLNGLNVQFRLSNLSELELNAINTALAQAEIMLRLGTNTKEEFTSLREQIKLKLNKEVISELELIDRRNDIEGVLYSSLSTYFRKTRIDKSSLDEDIEKLRNVKIKLDTLIQSKDEIEALIPIDKVVDINASKLALENIQNLFDRYIEVESNNQLRKEFVTRVGNLDSVNSDIKIKLKRYNSALAVLDDIILVNNPSNFLQTFFKENKQSILDIFKSIHLPNEFEDIEFKSAEVIRLKVKNSTENRDLTEVSTGQKAAFILSLYLTLNNNLKNGPPLMIFDDPVAYVDDINTLSFLDFLRETAIVMDRQIFFATANSKLANIFQQKFDFLGDELQIIRPNKIVSTS